MCRTTRFCALLRGRRCCELRVQLAVWLAGQLNGAAAVLELKADGGLGGCPVLGGGRGGSALGYLVGIGRTAPGADCGDQQPGKPGGDIEPLREAESGVADEGDQEESEGGSPATLRTAEISAAQAEATLQ